MSISSRTVGEIPKKKVLRQLRSLDMDFRKSFVYDEKSIYFFFRYHVPISSLTVGEIPKKKVLRQLRSVNMVDGKTFLFLGLKKLRVCVCRTCVLHQCLSFVYRMSFVYRVVYVIIIKHGVVNHCIG